MEFATADAGSTDSNESLEWSTCAEASGAFPNTHVRARNLQLVPDTPGGTQADDIGNACGDAIQPTPVSRGPSFLALEDEPDGSRHASTTAPTRFPGPIATTSLLVGLPSRQDRYRHSPAPTPSNFSIEMHGAGLQAVVVGLFVQ